MNMLNDLSENRTIFFNFMKEKYKVFYKSNIFLRDLLYAIKSYYEKKGQKLTYAQAEKLALEFAGLLEKKGNFQLLKKNTWKVNFPLETSVNEVTSENVG